MNVLKEALYIDLFRRRLYVHSSRHPYEQIVCCLQSLTYGIIWCLVPFVSRFEGKYEFLRTDIFDGGISHFAYGV